MPKSKKKYEICANGHGGFSVISYSPSCTVYKGITDNYSVKDAYDYHIEFILTFMQTNSWDGLHNYLDNLLEWAALENPEVK